MSMMSPIYEYSMQLVMCNHHNSHSISTCTHSYSVAKDDSPVCDYLVITILNESRNSRIR